MTRGPMPMALTLSRLFNRTISWLNTWPIDHGPHRRSILKLTLSNELNSTLTPNNSKGVKLDINKHVHEPSGKNCHICEPTHTHVVLYLLQMWWNIHYFYHTDAQMAALHNVILHVQFNSCTLNMSHMHQNTWWKTYFE